MTVWRKSCERRCSISASKHVSIRNQITDDDRSPRIASRLGFYWWARQDSNLEPDGYEPSALTIELRAHAALLIAEVRYANSLDDDFVQSYPRAQQSRYARFL